MENPLVITACFAVLMIGSISGYKGELVNGLPVKFQNQLEVLKLAVSMNDVWSEIFSEKVTKDIESSEHPDPEICMSMKNPESESIDTFEVIKKILENCHHSGLFVEYGMKLLGHSVKCFFLRFAKIHMSTVEMKSYDSSVQFTEFVQNLLVDYRTIADKLAAVSSDLTNILELANYYRDMVNLSSKYTSDTFPIDLKSRITVVSNKLWKRINEEFGKCACKSTEWFDNENNEIVNLKDIKEIDFDAEKRKKKEKKKKKKNKDKENNDEEKKNDKKKKKEKDKKKNKNKDKGEAKEVSSDGQTESDDEKPKEKKKDKEKKKEKKDKKKKIKKDPIISHAEELRNIMSRVFDKLQISEMSQGTWEDIFTAYIF